MLKKIESKQSEIEMVILEDLIPENHLLREIEVNLAYRWFLGYKINESVPHHSTPFSKQ
jgi:hypothetical protein